MRHSLKRWTAVLLALVMTAGLLPMSALPAAAQTEQTESVGTLDHTDVISLPITIRNHAADGMLFEWDGIGSGEYEEKPFRNPYNTSDITEPIPYVGANPAVGQLFCNDWDVSSLNKNGIQYHYGETYDSRYAHIAPGSTGWHEYNVWNRQVDDHLDTRYMVIRFRNSDFGSDTLFIKRYTDNSNYKQAGIDLRTDAASGAYKLVGTEDGWTTITVDLNDSSVQKANDHDGTPASAVTKISIGFNGNHSLDVSFIAFFKHLENNGDYADSFRYCAYDFINQDYCFRMDEPTITMVDPIPAAGLNVLTTRENTSVTVTGEGSSVVNHATSNTGSAYDSDKYITVTAGSEAADATVWSGNAYTGRYVAIRCENKNLEMDILVNGESVKHFNPEGAQEGSDGVLEAKTEGNWRTLIYDLGEQRSASSLGFRIPADSSLDLAYLGIFRDYSLLATSGYNYATDAHIFVFEDYSYRHDRASYGDPDVEQYQVYKVNDVIRFKQKNGSNFTNFDPTVAVNVEYPFTIGGTKADLDNTAVNGVGEEVNGTWKYFKLTDTANDRGIGARQVLLTGVNKPAKNLQYVVVSYCVADKGSAIGDTIPMYVMLDTAASGFDYSTVTLGFFDAVADGRWHVDTLDLSECVSRAPNGETYRYKTDAFSSNATISRIGLADGWAVCGMEFQLAYMAFFSTEKAADQYGNAYSEGNKRFNYASDLSGTNAFSVITNAFAAKTGQLRDDANLVKHLDGNQNNFNAGNLEYWEDANGNKRFRVGSNNGFELIDPDYAYQNNNYYHANTDGWDSGANNGTGAYVPNYYKDMGFGEWIRNDGGYSNDVKALYTNYNVGNNNAISYYNDDQRRDIPDINGASGIYGSSTDTYGYMMGLTERDLSEDGRVVYRKEVVEYLAQLLQKALSVPRTFMWYGIQFYSANYVQGDVDGERFGYYDEEVDGEENVNAMFPRDYAGWLRYKLGVTNRDGSLTGNTGILGNWTQTQEKAARLLNDREEIETWTDAAYYMLNTLFMDSAGVNVPEYKYLQLTRETPADGGDSYYVFDTRYSNIMFDFDKGVISNNSPYVNPDEAIKVTTNGSVAVYAFLPILRELPEFRDTFPYLKDTGIANKDDGADSYYNRDYNFTLECHGTFTYYAEKNLFFEFDGDDDVYLYVDGRCVLDLGGAHRPANQKIYLNDYVNNGLLNLQDDEDYTFDFYFMERHGTGSNLRIMTNMEVYADNIETAKTASQNGVDLPDYSIADFTQPVSYSFSVTNNFDPLGKLYNFSFKDSDVGFYAGFDSVALGDVTTGMARAVTDLTLTVTNSGGSVVYTGNPTNNDQLMLMLTDPGGRGGLAYGETLTLSGVKYTIGGNHSAFSNTVISRAGKHSGVAYHHLLSNTSSNHFYAWKGHELQIPIWKILQGKDERDTGSWSDIYRCNDSLNALTTGDVVVDRANGVVKVNYSSTGTRRLNFTSNDTSLNTPYPISVDVHVLDAADSVYVLDFDGQVALGRNSGTDNEFSIAQNDLTALPGVATKVRYEAVSDEAPVYRNNLLYLDDKWPKEPAEQPPEPPTPTNYTLTVSLGSNMSASGGALSQTLAAGTSITPITVSPSDYLQYYISQPTITGSSVTASFIPKDDILFINMSNTNIDWLGDSAVQYIYFFTDNNQNCWRRAYQVDTFNSKVIYAVQVPKDGNGNYYKNMIVVRKDPNYDHGGWGHNDGEWNKSCDINISGFGTQKNYISAFTENSFTFNSVYSGPAKDKLGSWTLTGTLNSDVTVTFGNAAAPAAAPADALNSAAGQPAPVTDGEPNYAAAPFYYQNNAQVTTIPAEGLDFTTEQGKFTVLLPDTDGDLPLLNFQPVGIMDGAATIWLTSRVYEDKEGVVPGTHLGNVDISKEVEMFQAVTVVPANVVYYEDTNDGENGIHYHQQNNTSAPTVVWTHSGVGAPVQSADQSAPYGYDAGYVEENDNHNSGNSETTITFKGNVTLADFDFTGTGFDLFSRCETNGPTLILRVYNASEDENHDYSQDTAKKTVYVATEFSNYNAGENVNEAMYQVPVTSVHDLEFGKYHVVLDGIGRLDMANWNIVKEGDNYYLISKTDESERWLIHTDCSPVTYEKGDDVTTLSPASMTMTFYLDGLRVYGALSASDQEQYYNPGEANASFIEVKDLLTTGRGTAVNFSAETTNFTTEAFTTTVELHNEPSEGFPLNDNGGANLSYYFLVGPNNELYLNGKQNRQAVVFSLVPEGSGAKTFQIAAKLLDSSSFGNGESSAADLSYLTAANEWKQLGVVRSGTELYYELDPTLCPQFDGAFTVIIATGTTQEIPSPSLVSLTKVKYKGWSFKEDYSTEMNFIEENGVIIGITDGGSKTLSNVIRLLSAAPKPTLPFKDVPGSAYYAPAVFWAWREGITSGSSKTAFGPKTLCTRAQIVSFLWNAAGKPEPHSTTSFADVPASAYYAKAVAWAVENGIAFGTTDTTFSPKSACTRAQAVVFLWRYAGSPSVDEASGFSDVPENAYYAAAVNWAVSQGVTSGTTATTFSPKKICSRAQIVTFLYRYAESVKGGDLP